jgi:glutamyl-tRNA(Gln) amidotransferase subunit E
LNPVLETFDYEGAGLKCGLEIHYQLDTKTKLFCRCPVGLRNDPHDAEIVRHMRPTLSELGEYDGTALMEFKTKKEVHYQLFYDTVCTYEMDDTPPFSLNREALEIALEIALLLNCQAADEIHVSRKQYLDGSIPTGFQRTIAVGINGHLPFRGRRIGILQVCLEEDACREVSDRGHTIVFRTDRLSTPLVEVITAPDMRTPDEAMEVDRELGRVLRATGKVRRGIGTVRQDVNVSVEGGTRAEIKGVPRTGLIRGLVHYEGVRQSALLRLKGELQIRGISGTTFCATPSLSTELFAKTGSGAIARAVEAGGVVGAVRLCGFAGLLRYPLSPNRTFADELKGRVRVIACLDREPILFHSDMPVRADAKTADGLTGEEWGRLRKQMAANLTDGIVVVWGNDEDVRTAMNEIAIRAREAIGGVPNETRQVMKGGETGFERILPGPNRMYPDTDSAPFPIDEGYIDGIRTRLPRSPAFWRERYGGVISSELLDQLIDGGRIEDFDGILEETGCDPVFIAYTLTSTLKRLGGRGGYAHFFRKEDLTPLFRDQARGDIEKGALPSLLAEIADKNRPKPA